MALQYCVDSAENTAWFGVIINIFADGKYPWSELAFLQIGQIANFARSAEAAQIAN